MYKIQLFFICFFTVLASSLAQAQVLVLATYQYSSNNRIHNIQPLADYLSQQLNTRVEVKSYPSVHLFIEGIQNNEVDIALINTFGYLLLQTSSTSFQMKPRAVLQVKEGTPNNYTTAIVSSAALKIDSLAQLKKAAREVNLLLVSEGSTSGNLVPRLGMSAIGIEEPEKDFLSVKYGGNHQSTIEALVMGKADVAAVGSTEYFKVKNDPEQNKQIKLLWLSPEIPLGPVLLHNRLTENLQHAITELLLNLHQTQPSVLEAVKNGWSEAKQAEKYIPIDDAYYEPFRSQLGNKKVMNSILKKFAN